MVLFQECLETLSINVQTIKIWRIQDLFRKEYIL